MTRKFNTALFTASSILFLASAANAAPMGAVTEPIKLTMLEWTGQHVSSHVAGNILESMGYKVDYVTAGNFPQFSGLADGTLSASVEIWMNNVGDIFGKALDAKQIEDIGPLKLKTNEGWLYPKYMEKVCPGLPDFKALEQPKCVEALATPDTFPNGRLLDYPADWGSRGAEIIKNNNLPLSAVPAGSEGALVAELESATAANRPILMMFWAPHPALAGKDIAWVKLPPCDPTNKTECITPPDVEKIVWSGFSTKWPAAYAFLQHFEVNADDQEQMMMRVEKNGESIEAVTKEWVATHKAVWTPWVQAAVAGN